MQANASDIPAIGHNGGPALTTQGRGWATHCWGQARRSLLPHLPVEMVRLRVRRAAELGLDYKTYAGVRATTGRDLVAFLFSSNALGLHARRMVPDPVRGARLAGLADCGRIALAQAPLTPETVFTALPVLDAVAIAPAPHAPPAIVRDRVRAALGTHPAATVLLVGDTAWERDWCAVAGLAGYLAADRYFHPV